MPPGRTAAPLRLAAGKGHAEAIGLLIDMIERGATVGAVNMEGATALFLAAQEGKADVVGLLIEKGANVDAANAQGATPLLLAAMNGHAEAVGLLVEGGANVDVADEDGVTPLHTAAKNGHAEVVGLLIKGGDKVDAVSDDATPLFNARFWDRADAAVTLVRAGADPTRTVDGLAYKALGAALNKESAATTAAVEAAVAETSVVSIMEWHAAAADRLRVAAALASQARDRGLRHAALLPGTRLRVGKYGEGVYQGWEQYTFGTNKHFVRFDGGGVQKVELKKLRADQWSVISELVAAEPEPILEGLPPALQAAEPEPEAEPERTFACSNFKREYDKTSIIPITKAAQIVGKIPEFIHVYCYVHGVTSGPEKAAAEAFAGRLADEAGKHAAGGGGELTAPVQATAELLWTSASTFSGMGVHDREFCFLLNAAIRQDHPELSPPAAMLSRGINAMCVEGRSAVALPFPAEGMTYRGGGFDDSHRGFFSVRKQFRQPCFLATSFAEGTAESFRQMAQAKGFQSVLWVVSVDPEGETDVAKRCKHVNFVAHSLIPGEKEYLFTAYSIFTARAVAWGVGGAPQWIELDAASDNQAAAEGGPGR